MKKILTMIALLGAVAVTAQDDKVKIGFKAVAENTIMFGGSYVGLDVRHYRFQYITPGLGIQAVVPIQKLIHVETGLYFHQQKYGWTETQNINGQDVFIDDEQTFQFIQLPVLLRLDFKDFYAAAGTTLNYELADNEKINVNYVLRSFDPRFGVGIMLSVGKDIKVNDRMSVITEVRAHGIPGRGCGLNAGIGLGLNYKMD